MVLTAEQKKENKRLTNKRYREKNKEKLNEINRLKAKFYREKNKEKIKEYRDKYQKNNKEKLKKKRETDEGRKNTRKASWKHHGLIWESEDEYNDIYNRYLNSLRCEKCSCEYTENNKKCMDHDHNTGKFRNVLCIACNVVTDVKISKNNRTGVVNISYNKKQKKWIYAKIKNNKKITKYFKYFIQAVIFKREYEESQI